ncbi:DUF4062 domain-containing protein [Sphingomonas faeni]|nr:DUF4062 domain-containing protein [Sphingomonas faeni]MCK8457887.1 DUF4062 domain-containing protein [Sphingomonas faeni]
MDVKLIRAFIASPSGLETERHAAFAAANEINKSVAMPMGGRLELIGWEETLSGNGRPQAIINAEMETCDLFIGAIWTSWGSKPATDGLYSSGFEEEFELSRSRHDRTGSPVMAMFFKSVDPVQARDPGKDLNKVFAFQEKLRSEKNFLYGTFAYSEEFTAKVREFLSTHVIRLLRQLPIQQDDKARERVNRIDDTEDPLPEQNGGKSPDAMFLNDAASDIFSDKGLQSVEVARIRLIGTAYGRSENDKQVLAAHDANLIYSARKSFELSFIERYGLLESGLTSLQAENVPLWTWLAELTESRPSLLTSLSMLSEPAVQAGAIAAMRMLQLSVKPVENGSDDPIGEYWLGSKSTAAVKLMALHYLRDLGTYKELNIALREVELASKDTTTAALETAITIMMRSSEQEAVRYVLSTSFETLDLDVLSQVLKHLDEASIQELQTGLDHRSSVVRAAALREMSERDLVSIATLERARDDDAPVVRYAALQALDRLGQAPSLDEAQKILGKPKTSYSILAFGSGLDTVGLEFFELYAAERMRSMPVPLLEALLETSTHRVGAFQALAARRIGKHGEQLRADLEDGFETYFSINWPEGIKPPTGLGLLAFGIGNSDPAAAKKRELIRKALDIVAAQRDRNDLALVRSVLDTGKAYISGAVLSFFKALGAENDSERIGKTPRLRVSQPDDGGYYKDFTDAARLILKIHKGGSSELMKLDIPIIMKAKIIEIMPAKDFAALPDEEIVDMLLSSDDNLRRTTARKTPASVTRSRVTKILNLYQSHDDGRYYVVTHWLDLGLAYDRPTSRRVVEAGT